MAWTRVVVVEVVRNGLLQICGKVQETRFPDGLECGVREWSCCGLVVGVDQDICIPLCHHMHLYICECVYVCASICVYLDALWDHMGLFAFVYVWINICVFKKTVGICTLCVCECVVTFCV